MDTELKDRLQKWHTQIDAVAESSRTYLGLEASEKPLYSQLFLGAQGKSIAEREAHAYASDAWRDFSNGLVVAKTEFNRQMHMLELKKKAFDAAYLTAKLENDGLKRPQS